MKFLEAVLILSGMIIGVGMFGIPFSFAQAGFWLGVLELVFVTALILTLHLLYAETVLATEKFHRLPGYVSAYLGRRVGLISWFSALFGIIGTLLAYVVLGSVFLSSLFEKTPVSWDFVWALVFVALGAATTFFPLKKEAAINGVLTALLIAFILVLAAFLIPGIKAENLSELRPENFFIPYGVLLFALAGTVVVPDLVTLLGRERRKVRLAIWGGTLIPAAVYFLFALAVVGRTGEATTPEAIRGLLPVAGSGVVFLGNLIGLLAVFTSFVVLAKSFQALLALDLGFSRSVAWVSSFAAPLILYLMGFQNFILIIAAVGALAVGLDAPLVIWTRREIEKRKREKPRTLSLVWRWVLGIIIISGVVYEVFRLVRS